MSHETLVHHAVRPLVRCLRNTGLRPNHVTLLRIALAVAAAACFTRASALLLDVGAALFALSAIFDRIDGELARQTGRFSRLGHWLDLVGDCSAEALVFIGIGYGGSATAMGDWALLLGLAAALGTMALFWQFNIRSGQAEAPPRLRALDPDDAVFLVPALLLAFGPLAVVVMAGTVTPLVAAYAIWRRVTL